MRASAPGIGAIHRNVAKLYVAPISCHYVTPFTFRSAPACHVYTRLTVTWHGCPGIGIDVLNCSILPVDIAPQDDLAVLILYLNACRTRTRTARQSSKVTRIAFKGVVHGGIGAFLGRTCSIPFAQLTVAWRANFTAKHLLISRQRSHGCLNGHGKAGCYATHWTDGKIVLKCCNILWVALNVDSATVGTASLPN